MSGTFIYANYDNTVDIGNANSGELPDVVSRNMDTVGDGSGLTQVTGDYSGAEERFIFAPEAGEIVRLHRLIVFVEGSNGFSSTKYGNLGTLTTGIGLELSGDLRDTIDLMHGEPVKSNGSWAQHCYDADLKSWGVGNDMLAVRWTFDKSGIPIRLVGSSNDKLEIIVNDDFTGLDSHLYMIQGHYE